MPAIEIKHLNRDEIDHNRWNETIKLAVNTRVYGFTWYLDAMTNNSWSGLVIDEYAAVFPLVSKKFLVIPYVTNPYLCQQLGIFSLNIEDEKNQLKHIIRYLKCKYLKSDILIRSSFEQWENVTPKTNHILNLSGQYNDLYEKYNRNTKRNIKKSEEYGVELLQIKDINIFVNFLTENDKSHLLVTIKNSITCLIDRTLKMGIGHMIVAKNNDQILATAYWIDEETRVYFLLCASNHIGSQTMAMYQIIDFLIKKYSNSPKLLDFTGSSIDNIARRNEGFGAIKENYYHLKLNWNPF